MNDSNPTIPTGDIAFFDNYLPTLEDGTYTISVSSEISGNGIDTSDYFQNPITREFEVRGPQFSLPSTEVHSVYPPDNSNSRYDQFLPNIVLNKRVLPWERYFAPKDKTIPWLCLLVFKESEISINPKTNSALQSSNVRDFLAANDEIMKPDIPLDSIPSDVLKSLCSYIKITAEVFRDIAPKVEELKYLAHVRQVDMTDRAVMDSEERGWFSVITGNRLLKTSGETGERFHVHLVSLEGYYDYMKKDNPTPWPKKKSDPSLDKDIALISLYNWRFLSQPEQLNFAQLVENFVSQSKGQPDNLLLRRYVDGPANSNSSMTDVLTRFQNGYVPLNYQTPMGDKTFAWYRGPLTPVVAQPLPRASSDYHFPSSASVMIFDKKTGLFDQTYAAAWSIGRALALADGSFSQALLRFRRKSYGLIGQLMDNLESIGDATKDDLSQIVQSSVVRDTFKNMIAKQTGNMLSQMLNNPVISATTQQTPSDGQKLTTNRVSPVEATKNFLAAPAVQALLKAEVAEELLPIVQWLARKQLLYDVPFDHLVPDPLMLPVESLRFFYIDQNWLDTLVDGALSVGIQSSKDAFYTRVMRGVITESLTEEVNSIRNKIIGTSTGDVEADSQQQAMSGLLIRSAVISGWPGLAVKAFKGDYQTGTQLKMLRMDRLSPNVLLCVFLDIPDTVTLAEPPQGLSFGVEDNDVINLRQLSDPPGKPLMKDFPQSGGFETFQRSPSNDVLNINDGPDSIIQTLQQSQYLGTTIAPAQFALEMVKAPEQISFKSAKKTS